MMLPAADALVDTKQAENFYESFKKLVGPRGSIDAYQLRSILTELYAGGKSLSSLVTLYCF